MAERLPTTGGYRAAVRTILGAVQRQYGLSDRALADRIGCSPGTIRNAKAEHGNLSGLTIASIEKRFGAGTIDPFLALGGSRAAPLVDQLPDIDPILEIVEALHRLIAAQHASSEHGFLITSRELLEILHDLRNARTAFDVLIALAQTGVANASPDLRRWFVDLFEQPAPTMPNDDAGALPQMPPEFADAATQLTDDELMERFGVSRAELAAWLRQAEDDILDQAERDGGNSQR